MTEDYNNYGFPKLPEKPNRDTANFRLRARDGKMEIPAHSKMQALAGKGMAQDEHIT